MGSDRSRRSYDESRQYRRVVPQQGRVVVEADGNEAQEIVTEEIRKEALDIVGPAGTPDDGYEITPLSVPETPFELKIGAGTMYVGGMRVSLAEDAYYFNQPDWFGDPDSPGTPSLEHVYLHLREQEVSAVEDRVLREAALGGPDTAQRTRLIQRIERRAVMSSTCAGAWAQTVGAWESKGLFFDPKTMRLGSHSKLQVQFTPPLDPPNLCAPEVVSGYLGAENQLIRVQVAAPAAANDPPDKLLWAFDNASALYRVAGGELIDPVEQLVGIDLADAPVDAHHFPRAGQFLEVLGSAVQLEAGEHIAQLTGVTYPIIDYDPIKRRIVIQGLIDETFILKYVRIWEDRVDLVAGTPIPLGATGVRVTLTTPAGKPFVAGDHWLIGVRPKTPDQVYPRRLLAAPQPPDGPREWVCPLAVLHWVFPLGGPPSGSVAEDCRQHFDNLVELTKKPLGCCTVMVWPEDLTGGTTLQSIIDAYIPVLQAGASVAICLQPGEYALSEPLRLTSDHAGLCVEGCRDQVVLRAAAGAESAFLDGLIVLAGTKDIHLHGLILIPPNVDFDAAGGQLAGHTTAELNTASTGAIDFRGLTVSIGLRVVSSVPCHDIQVHDCTFELVKTAPSGSKSFYAGIFVSGLCTKDAAEMVGTRPVPLHPALDVQRCTFSARNTLSCAGHHAFGFLVTPSTTFQFTTESGITSGTVVQPQIDDVLFRDNTFSSLTAAVFLSAETGLVRFEDNTVIGCYAGFWSVSLHTLSRTDSQLGDRLVAASLATPAVSVSQLVAMRNDPVVTIGSAVGRAYPPPQAYSGWSPTPIDTATGTLDSLHAALVSIERPLINRVQFPTIGLLKLHATGNDIDSMALSGSSAALAVWDTEPGPLISDAQLPHPGEAQVGNNRLAANASLTTAAIVMVRRCTLTGNIITNEANLESGSYSLVVLGQEASPRVAVTGNVLTQYASLPDRSGGVPAWISLNSQESV